MKKKTIRNGMALLLASFMLAGCSKGAGETHVVNLDFQSYTDADEMFAAADAVLIGTVTEVREEILDISLSDEPLEYPYYIYTIQVEQVIKGSVGSEYEIKVLGGEMDGEVYCADEEVDIEVGSTYLIATEEYYEYDEDSYPSLLNYEQACVACEADAEEIEIIGENINIQAEVQ